MNFVDPEDGPDAELTVNELPIPEVRQKRDNAHVDRKLIRQLWHKPVPGVGEARKKRSRLVPEFQYTKLKKGEIRLISLRPYKTTELASSPVFARVFTRRLEDVRGRYEALSYSWGDQSAKPSHEIHLRNLSHTLPDVEKDKGEKFSAAVFAAAALRIKFYRFPVYKNLYDALMRLRGMLRPIILWVDAICIDQSESAEEEKRQQLQMMDDIYQSAANVCVWLGSGFRGSADGIQLAREINNFQTFDKLLANRAAERRWSELIQLLKSPWFGRRWIIQEIALAREASLHCGGDRIHWDDFAEAASLLLDCIGLLRKSFRDEIFDDVEMTSGFVLVATLSSVCRKPDKGDVVAKTCDLETLVSTLLGFHATYPKDTIYAVISLARDYPKVGEEWEQALHAEQLKRLSASATHQGAAYAPNRADCSIFFKYKLSARDVFIAFVTRSVYSSGCLDIVCRHWAPPVLDRYGEEVSMPSWVSPLVRSPYGLAGTFKGRQNSDNLVAYSSDDRRKQYSAAEFSTAEIAMIDDQSYEFQLSHPLISIEPTATIHDTVVQPPSKDRPLNSETSGTCELLQTVEPPAKSRAVLVAGPSEQATNTNSNGTDTARESQRSQRAVSAQPPSVSRFETSADSTPLRPVKSAITRSGRTRKGSWLQRQPIQAPDLERTHYLSGVLAAQGFVVGRIRDVSEVMRGGIVPGKWIQELGWAEDDSNHVPELLWRTLVADRTPRGGYPPPWYKRACLHALHDPRKTDREGSLHSVAPPDREISEHSTMYLRRVESVVWNRRLFVTDPIMATAANGDHTKGLNGPLFGIGPSGTEAGHLVCILLGCSVPVVLGEGSRRGLFRIVGEAYVHGIMDGEAMRLNAPRIKFLLE